MNTQMLVDEAIEALESQIDDTAIIACSGGIDSSVAAVLAHRAVGSLLHCVYVDTGFMRKGETEEVREMFNEMGIELQVVDASVRFFSNLEGITDPEEKRKAPWNYSQIPLMTRLRSEFVSDENSFGQVPGNT